MNITWTDIDNAMGTFRPTTGGFSVAKRGIVTLSDRKSVFVKLAVNAETKGFIDEEIKSYKWLAKKGYQHMPELLLFKPGGIVLPDLSQFDWSDNWTEKKLKKILEALDQLGDIQLTKEDKAALKDVVIGNGWREIKEDADKKDRLIKKLKSYPKLVNALDERLDEFADKCDEYQSARDKFVPIHADARADNFAYDEATGRVYLADWNWMGLGRKGHEDVGLLVSAAKAGFDVDSFCPERIDVVAALYLAGFWLSRSMNKIWEGGDPSLRDFQFESAMQAAKWAGLV